MIATDMRALSAEELNARVGGWEEELFRARSNKVVGQLNNPNIITSLRRTIARAHTIIKEAGSNAAE